MLLSVAAVATEIQSAITEFEPFDSSADWTDIDAYLPDTSQPLARAVDAETRERLRLLLLRAVREGSVPHMDVEALSVNEDRSANSEAEALLSMVINDLGSEIDERFEYVSAYENFEVFVKPEVTPAEEDIVDDALDFVEALGSDRIEPLRFYQREVQHQRLISAQEEIKLSRAMESELEAALDALAAWPHGIEQTLAGGRLVSGGQRPLTWMSLGPIEAHPDVNAAIDCGSTAETAALDQTDDEVEYDSDVPLEINPRRSNAASEFLVALAWLAKLPVGSIAKGTDWRAVRATLSSLRLNRRFLSHLADLESDGEPASATQFATAMKAHQLARERMAVANLKLVFHLAKKYLYSGEPLDDLAQEGNIGLLKAVERFDWRRGFKFSTYATWWIRQQVGRYVADKSRTIRIPVHIHEKAQRLARETRAFEHETGRTPQLQEIAARMGMPAYKVAALQRLAPEPLPIHELRIDELIAVEARIDFVSPDPMDIVSQSELRHAIDKVLATLKPQEEQILRLRFGIGVEDSLTLDEIGRRYELTRERIRQIEAKTILKLKRPSSLDVLARAVFDGPLASDGTADVQCLAPVRSTEATEIQPIQRPTKPDPARARADGSLPAQLICMESILSRAKELGVPIEDGRDGATGKLWVKLIAMHDVGHYKLSRNLLTLGFECVPGKGYSI